MFFCLVRWWGLPSPVFWRRIDDNGLMIHLYSFVRLLMVDDDDDDDDDDEEDVEEEDDYDDDDDDNWLSCVLRCLCR